MLAVEEETTVAELSLDIIGVLAELDETADFEVSSDEERGGRDSSDDSMDSLGSLDIEDVLEDVHLSDDTEDMIKQASSLPVTSTPTGHVSTASTTDRMLNQFDELVEETMEKQRSPKMSPKLSPKPSPKVNFTAEPTAEIATVALDSTESKTDIDAAGDEESEPDASDMPSEPVQLLKRKSRKIVVETLIQGIKGGVEPMPEIKETDDEKVQSPSAGTKATSSHTESSPVVKPSTPAESIATVASAASVSTEALVVDDDDDDLYADPDEETESGTTALKKGGPMLGDEIGKKRSSMGKMVKSLSSDVIKLPELCGYLHKKSTSTFAGWQKRWVIVKRTHILWSKTEEYIDNPLDIKQRRRFQNSVTLLQISNVGADKKDKKSRIFWLQTASKNYEFRAKDKAERDLWLDGLKQHLAALKQSMDFINERVLFKTTSKKRLTSR